MGRAVAGGGRSHLRLAHAGDQFSVFGAQCSDLVQHLAESLQLPSGSLLPHRRRLPTAPRRPGRSGWRAQRCSRPAAWGPLWAPRRAADQGRRGGKPVHPSPDRLFRPTPAGLVIAAWRQLVGRHQRHPLITTSARQRGARPRRGSPVHRVWARTTSAALVGLGPRPLCGQGPLGGI